DSRGDFSRRLLVTALAALWLFATLAIVLLLAALVIHTGGSELLAGIHRWWQDQPQVAQVAMALLFVTLACSGFWLVPAIRAARASARARGVLLEEGRVALAAANSALARHDILTRDERDDRRPAS